MNREKDSDYCSQKYKCTKHDGILLLIKVISIPQNVILQKPCDYFKEIKSIYWTTQFGYRLNIFPNRPHSDIYNALIIKNHFQA